MHVPALTAEVSEVGQHCISLLGWTMCHFFIVVVHKEAFEEVV